MIVREEMGDLFDCSSQTITCPINAVGAMGAGLALEFRNRVPGLYDFYSAHYPRPHRQPNPRMHYLQVFKVPDGRQILLFPTKDDWRNPSERSLIEANLIRLAESWEVYGIQSLALPALGCGLGQLSYDRDVRPMIHDILGPLPLPVEVLFRYQATTRY